MQFVDRGEKLSKRVSELEKKTRKKSREISELLKNLENIPEKLLGKKRSRKNS